MEASLFIFCSIHFLKCNNHYLNLVYYLLKLHAVRLNSPFRERGSECISEEDKLAAKRGGEKKTHKKLQLHFSAMRSKSDGAKIPAEYTD